MINGKKYRIITKIIPGFWNKHREMVFTFVAEDERVYTFSARPLAGTQEIEKDQIAEMWEVHDDIPIMLPRIYRGEKRVL